MTGILLIMTFIFLFLFGYHMCMFLDRFLNTHDFSLPECDTEKDISKETRPTPTYQLDSTIKHHAS